MIEREWLLPCLALTVGTVLFACLAMPDHSGMIPALSMLPLWMGAAAFVGAILGFSRMVSARVPSPIAHIWSIATSERKWLVSLTFCMLLTGLNMVAFMWTKPLLNYIVPFRADLLLADADRFLFLGHDPWTLLTWLNSHAWAVFYHRGWFALMILTLIIVANASPSVEKSAVMLTYFLLWSVVGPLIHTLIPAAGPIFFAELGYGERFSGLAEVAATREVAAYLWSIYSETGFGPGSGISAMPSMHIATSAWMMIAFILFAPRWSFIMAICALLIFLLSIALGWHYAMDGIVGAAAALLCYRTSLAFYRQRHRTRLSNLYEPAFS